MQSLISTPITRHFPLNGEYKLSKQIKQALFFISRIRCSVYSFHVETIRSNNKLKYRDIKKYPDIISLHGDYGTPAVSFRKFL